MGLAPCVAYIAKKHAVNKWYTRVLDSVSVLRICYRRTCMTINNPGEQVRISSKAHITACSNPESMSSIEPWRDVLVPARYKRSSIKNVTIVLIPTRQLDEIIRRWGSAMIQIRFLDESKVVNYQYRVGGEKRIKYKVIRGAHSGRVLILIHGLRADEY